MKRITIYGLLVLAVVAGSTLMFQNCSGGIPPATQSATLPSSDGTTRPPTSSDPANWATGDAFGYNNLPVAMQTQMVQVQITSLGYFSTNQPKAIAISADGLGFVRIGVGMTQEQTNQIAKDGCYVISGAKPCSLIAVGDRWNVSRNDLNNSFTYSMTTLSGVPFVPPSAVASIAAAYNSAPLPKALAISLDGAYFFISNTSAEPVGNTADAVRIVMERCEMGAGFVPCMLFAQDNSLVFNPATINRAPVIDYARTTVSTNLPGIRQAQYTSAIQNDYLTRTFGNNLSGAIYITADGAAGYSYDPSAINADTNARTKCNNNAIPAFPCFKYATNKNVVQPFVNNLTALRVFGYGLHCQVMPRASCSAHKAMGCPAGGRYYTQQGLGIAVETCN